MATLYEARGAWWSSETDDYEDGCIAPGADGYASMTLRGGTVADVLAAIREHVGAITGGDPELDLNSCDETGRVDVCGTTTDLDDPRSWWMPTEAESDAWKRRERSLYYTVWTFYVERVTTEKVDLEPVTA